MTSAVSNPFSTGSGGPFFEAKVQAGFLLHLLIGGRIPFLPNGSVQSIRLQGKQAGFATDDVIVTVRTEADNDCRLLAQVKHRAAITVSDSEFSDALASAWADFNNPNVFSQGQDALALITGPQSDKTLQHVRPILDWARTSANGAEFTAKVATSKFSSDHKRAYLQVFKDVLAKAAGTVPTDDILWQFLKHFHLLSYDFDILGGKDEAAILTVLELARNPSGTLDAQAIWEGLIIQAQEWNKTAGTFTLAQLDERLRMAVHSGGSPVQRQALSKLQEHSVLVLNTIQTELAPRLRLSRNTLLDVLVDTIESSRVVIVQGAPGAGKSASVKMLLDALPAEIVPFAFKAQEFNHPHLHQFLTSIGIGLSVAQLRSEFALLPRKVLLIDGAERLFELSSLEAFRQLLQQLSGDASWTIVITCRESSAQLLKEHLLAQWGAEVTTVAIPPLTVEELGWVLAKAPHLAPLIANQKLIRLLQLPFILSLAWKAFPPSASTNTLSDIDERQFKDLVWREYVERAPQAQGGMRIKRSQCLLAISVERARKMSLFVGPVGCDADALQALVNDTILIESSVGGFAPAHDVLEDWSVTRFIAQEFETKAGDTLQFFDAVGAEPAMRRGFRLWLADALTSSGHERVMDFVLSVFQHTGIPPIWHDEIAVAVLQSDSASRFIHRAEALLLDKGKFLYKRLIHVLRTACKGPNDLLLTAYGMAAFRNHLALGTVFVIPAGSGWSELIFFTHRHIDAFDLQAADTVLGLLNDWTQGFSSSDPLPPEAPAAAEICMKYWRLLTVPSFYADRLEQDFLKLLFKIPHGAPVEVSALIHSALADQLVQHHSRTILEHVTKSIECQPLCAHLPDLVIEVAEKTWTLQPDDDNRYNSHPDLEELFGFEHSVHFNYFPQSALQGPFVFLLASHPDIAVDFIVRLTNRAALSYSQSRMRREVSNIQLPAAEGSRPLIASWRLWALYRGMMPGPQVLECALMSLEAWLLGQAKQNSDIRGAFRRILESSSSTATLAVLASVAVAYPQAVGEEALPLLGVREFYRWDFERSHQEYTHVTDVRASLGIPSGGGIDEIYYGERKESGALPHRKSNLEELAFRLQFTHLRDRVFSIIDQFHAALPPIEQQTETDRTWRIALHRIDARHFKAEESKEPSQIMLIPSDPAPDLQQYIAKAAENFAPAQRRIQLVNWGMLRFRREDESNETFTDWRHALSEARVLQQQAPLKTDEALYGLSGPGFVAAYLIRDHYAELQPTELEWCRQVIIEEILREDAERTLDTRVSKNSLAASRPCAYVLPLLLQGDINPQIRVTVEETIAVAVTHTSEEVRNYAAQGVRDWMWEIDAVLAKACVGGLFKLANTEGLIYKTRRNHTDHSQEDRENTVLAAIVDIRKRIIERATATELNAIPVDLDTHEWRALLNAISMIQPDTTDADLNAFVIAHLAAVLHAAEMDEAWQARRNGGSHFEFQHSFASFFARFALARSAAEAARIGQILSNAVEKCPKYLNVLLEAFPYEEDKARTGTAFWSIWKSVSGPVFAHSLLRESSRVWRYDELRKLVRTLLFADVKFKDDVHEWAPVTENKSFFEHAAATVGNTEAGFGALLSLLCSVGRVFLPDAVTLLAQAFEKSQNRELLDDPNAAFQLEILLRKVCYEHGTNIRQRPALHRATLALLDQLVEHGSHTGFRLRDYIVAPLPAIS